MGDVAETIVLPFSDAYQCPQCSFVRSSAMQQKRTWCPGVSRETNPRMEQKTSDACRFGAHAHLHIQCQSCGYEFGMETYGGVPALTSDEVVRLREILSQMMP